MQLSKKNIDGPLLPPTAFSTSSFFLTLNCSTNKPHHNNTYHGQHQSGVTLTASQTEEKSAVLGTASYSNWSGIRPFFSDQAIS